MHKEHGVDLKEMVLSVLADMQAQEAAKKAQEPQIPIEPEPLPVCEVPQAAPAAPEPEAAIQTAPVMPEPAAVLPPQAVAASAVLSGSDDELQFLSDLRERLLVIFEGFQSPNNKAIEAKVDLVLNFLEYLLSVTEERLEALKRA